MNCYDVKEHLEQYIMDDLDENKKETVKTHIEACPSCGKEYQALKQSIESIHNVYTQIAVPFDKLDISKMIANPPQKQKVQRFFSMKKAFIAAACIFALLITAVLSGNPIAVEKVRAGEYRSGFSLNPLSSDSTGVKPDSSYLLKSKNDIDLKTVKQALSIEGEPAPEVLKEGKNNFLLKPVKAFEPNKLYTFTLNLPNGDIVTWTYQTSAAFKVSGVFPADKTIEVPANTGIEIYFSHENFEDLSKYFEITPKAEGRFERHKTAAVFVPKSLKESTLYTVKIKKGLKLLRTKYALEEDYVFRFETGTKNDTQQNPKGELYYNAPLSEFQPGEAPMLSVSCYVMPEQYSGNVKVKTAVYGFRNIDAFIDALNKKNSVPNWAYRSIRSSEVPSKGLDKVMEFTQDLGQSPNGPQAIKFPGKLSPGFYLVTSQWEDIRFQTFIQVTDIAMYAKRGNNQMLVWLNDISTQKPIEDAKITPVGQTKHFTTNEKGISFLELPTQGTLGNTSMLNSEAGYLKIETRDMKTSILMYPTWDYKTFNQDISSLYWNYMQLDRELYKPNDTINFWGFIKNRYLKEKIETVTLEISQGSVIPYYPVDANYKWSFRCFPIDNQPLLKQTASIQNGVFKGSIKLPSLEPGGYQFTVKKGDSVIVSSYINVANYTKPSYKLEVTKDKEAVFPGQEVNFNINASFFEGTGVPDLDVTYHIQNYGTGGQTSETAATNSNGSLPVKYRVEDVPGTQGEQYMYFGCRALLPESGEISEGSNLRVFVNDINVNLSSESKENKDIIHAVVNKIVLDRLNNKTAKDQSDFLGNPVEGKKLSGILYKNSWNKIEDGEYYDFINKVTEKRYRYEPYKEAVKEFSMVTDKNGKASYDFGDLLNKDCYYTAEITCEDSSERPMKFETGVGNQYSYPEPGYAENRYYLEGGEEFYDIGDKVNLTFNKGSKKLPDGSFLFIKSQNGIKEFTPQGSSNYSFNVQEKDVPNTYINGIYFTGKTYIESEQFNATYNYKNRNLVIEAVTDKPNYKPGDEVTVKIYAKDKDGKPQKSFVNISLVDEALFKLSEQQLATLATLYNVVPSGTDFSYLSHQNPGSGNSNPEVFPAKISLSNVNNFAGYSLNVQFNESLPARHQYADAAYELKNTLAVKAGGADGAYIRSDFKDTALFETIALDDKGYGEYRFKLPDNVTSWRISLSGVASDLHAGSNKVNLHVSLPFFINHSLNTTYLAGDEPQLGVSAYGSQLKEGDTVYFEVTNSSHPAQIAKAQGKVFQHVNIPIGEMVEGKSDIIIKAYTESGLSDALKQTVTTLKTYHQVEKAVYYDLAAGMKIEGGKEGNTTLLFADKGRGAFFPELTNLLYTSGKRVEQKLAQRTAYELLMKYFKDKEYEKPAPFNIKDYQREDGGLAILPYGSSDADVSARLTSLIKDEVNTQKLKRYFYSILYGDTPGLKGNALYGLAALREPVLLELEKASRVENSNVKDLIYMALAFCELGESPKAEKLYTERISPYMKNLKPYYMIDTGEDQDDMLSSTALAAVLASKLGKPERTGLYRYCASNTAKDILIDIERLLYMESEIEKAKSGPVSFSYSINGDKHAEKLEDGRIFTLTIPSQNIAGLTIDSVQGDVALVSTFKTDVIAGDKKDSNMTVSRVYQSKNGKVNTQNSFKQNEIVKVVLDWDISKKALDGEYIVTDFVPSGLKPIENMMNAGIEPGSNEITYRVVNGQKVTFYVSKSAERRDPLVYYARVVSPGTYKCESPIIQHTASKDSINFGEVQKMLIQ